MGVVGGRGDDDVACGGGVPAHCAPRWSSGCVFSCVRLLNGEAVTRRGQAFGDRTSHASDADEPCFH
jgi:hypothetical protein